MLILSVSRQLLEDGDLVFKSKALTVHRCWKMDCPRSQELPG